MSPRNYDTDPDSVWGQEVYDELSEEETTAIQRGKLTAQKLKFNHHFICSQCEQYTDRCTCDVPF